MSGYVSNLLFIQYTSLLQMNFPDVLWVIPCTVSIDVHLVAIVSSLLIPLINIIIYIMFAHFFVKISNYTHGEFFNSQHDMFFY